MQPIWMPVALSFPDNFCLESLYSTQNGAKWPYKIERTSETCSLIALLYLPSRTHARTHTGWVIEFVEVPINTPGVWLPWLHGPSLESHNVRQLYLGKVQNNRRVLREIGLWSGKSHFKFKAALQKKCILF